MTGTDVAELIAEAREWPRDGVNEGRLINALADALEAVTKERDEFKRLFSECHPVHLDGVQRAHKAEAERDEAANRIEFLELQDAGLRDDIGNLERERDALAAVIEKVREAIVFGARMDAHPTLAGQQSDMWWSIYLHNFDVQWRENMRSAISADPADVLREHDAALIESLADDLRGSPTSDPGTEWAQRDIAGWLREQAQKRRAGSE